MKKTVIRQIIELETKTTGELKDIYEKLYSKKIYSSAKISKQQLTRKIAYRLQELEYGFLPEKYAKKLDSLADNMKKGKQFKDISYFKPVNGTRLSREYKGVVYEVESAEKGFIFEGQLYNSLSAVARKITGTQWNGLRFFGAVK